MMELVTPTIEQGGVDLVMVMVSLLTNTLPLFWNYSIFQDECHLVVAKAHFRALRHSQEPSLDDALLNLALAFVQAYDFTPQVPTVAK